MPEWGEHPQLALVGGHRIAESVRRPVRVEVVRLSRSTVDRSIALALQPGSRRHLQLVVRLDLQSQRLHRFGVVRTSRNRRHRLRLAVAGCRLERSGLSRPDVS